MKQWVLTTEYATFVSYPVQKMCAMDGGDESGTRLLIQEVPSDSLTAKLGIF